MFKGWVVCTKTEDKVLVTKHQLTGKSCYAIHVLAEDAELLRLALKNPDEWNVKEVNIEV